MIGLFGLVPVMISTRLDKEECWSKFFNINIFAWIEWNLTFKDIGNVTWDCSIFFRVMVTRWKDWKMLIFSHQSDMEDKLWNLVNIHIHDIVVEL